jgi:uncharacterized membrane protein YbhN (UPF0104 family)
MTQAAEPAPRSRTGKLPLAWFIRLGVSGLVLAVIFHFVPVAEVWRQARALPPFLWIGGLCVFLAGHAASAAKWRLLIGSGVSYGQAFRAHLAGLAANLCLPSVAGGDVVRASMVFRLVDDRTRLMAGSVADRLLDTLGLVIIAGLGGLFASRFGPANPTSMLALGAAGVVALAAGFAVVLLIDRRLKQTPPTGKIGRLLLAVFGAGADLARHPGRLVACLAISMAVQAAFIGINIAFGHAAHIEVPTAAWFFAWASAKIIAIAPISLGGLGVREASMAALLRPFGADPAQVIAVGLLWQTVLYASGLIGLLVQLIWKPAPAQVVAENPS